MKISKYMARVRPAFDGQAMKGGVACDPIESLRAHYGASAGFGFAAARQGLSLALEAAGIGSGDRVILADYNCSSLVAAVQRVRAELGFVDLHADWSYDLDQLSMAFRDSSAKALVLTHFFGRSCVTDGLRELVEGLRRRGVLVIEDCAHTMMDRGQPEIGTLGDVALFSFGNDKPLGGAKSGVCLVRQAELGERIRERWQALPERSADLERLYAAWYLVYFVLSDASVFRPGVVTVLPDTGLCPGEAEFDELLSAVAESPTIESLLKFPSSRRLVEECGKAGTATLAEPCRMGAFARDFIGRVVASGMLEKGNAARTANRAEIERLAGLPAGKGAHLRYSVVYPDAAAASAAARFACEHGVEAACFNWSPLLSTYVGGSRELPGWAVTPSRVVNYPVHEFMTPDDLAVVAEAAKT